jgi:hypothetical protein
MLESDSKALIHSGSIIFFFIFQEQQSGNDLGFGYGYYLPISKFSREKPPKLGEWFYSPMSGRELLIK